VSHTVEEFQEAESARLSSRRFANFTPRLNAPKSSRSGSSTNASPRNYKDVPYTHTEFAERDVPGSLSTENVLENASRSAVNSDSPRPEFTTESIGRSTDTTKVDVLLSDPRRPERHVMPSKKKLSRPRNIKNFLINRL
jgi:hypothetical protein